MSESTKPILPTVPPPPPPSGHREMAFAARLSALATECEAEGVPRSRLAEIFAYVMNDTR